MTTIFASDGVIEIGLKSLSIQCAGEHLGMRVTRERFHCGGTTPLLIEQLISEQTGAANTTARFSTVCFQSNQVR